jgi:DNA-binding transcriptional LysR family regulator
MPRSTLRRYFRHGLFPQLMVFEAVARRSSVTRAAEELHLAQPTVSTQLGKLSETVGLKLYEHEGRGLRLTQAGRELQAACGELVELLERIETRLAALRAPRDDVLRLAAAPGARHLAARLLAAFCARHPSLRVSLHVAERSRLIERLISAEDDLSLVQGGDDRSAICMELASTELLRLYVAARHPLARDCVIPIETLASEPVLLREPASSIRGLLLAALAEHGVRPTVRAELGSNDAVAEAIAAGLGFGLLPEDEAAARAGAIEPLDVQGFPLKRQWYLAHAVRREPTGAAALFLREAIGGAAMESPGAVQVSPASNADYLHSRMLR